MTEELALEIEREIEIEACKVTTEKEEEKNTTSAKVEKNVSTLSEGLEKWLYQSEVTNTNTNTFHFICENI